ncbi:Phosphatidylinositol N-acetylglucosaminyltransferase subunit P [Geodia barretti]|uniref:Phosphatidylinositol N-acetylglucosaminyltransferase subunit P n=1 Tax=Geodia barretti TaxID=519541 RepID=A0AA35RJE0_GEOBA|nr:Phosphatidylinositol N-acetylglucosaminyltransferase subunit P [Geodia barretti]
MRIIDNLMALSADKGHSPFPSSERAVCGFALWLVSFLALGVFLMWAFVPDTWLTAIGFSYLPHKYWAVAFPSFVIVSALVGVVMYAGLNCMMVVPFNDPRSVQDPCPQFPSSSPSQPHSIPPLRDLDISQVNRVLYHRHHSSDPQTPTHPLSHGRSF